MPAGFKKLACANPLFLTWLENWRDEAKEKGLNSQWTFQKAINSLKKYPLPLHSGKDAMILENIGDSIALKLDKALADHCALGGGVTCITKATKHLSNSPRTVNKVERKRLQQNIATQNDNEVSCTGRETKGEKTKHMKGYIPKQGSGPYALLLTLHRESQQAYYKGFMMKDELQGKAESLSDKSFKIPDSGSHYTAWSSMSTLTSKGYVTKSSNPAKYSITESGTLLAKKLTVGESDCPQKPEISTFTFDDVAGNQASYLTSKKDPSSSTPKISTTEVGETLHKSGMLRFWYVTSEGALSSFKNDAEIQIDDTTGVCMFLIKCEDRDLMCSSLSYKKHDGRHAEKGFIYVYLADEDTIEKSNPPSLSKDVPLTPLSESFESVVAKPGSLLMNVVSHQPSIQTEHNNRISNDVNDLRHDAWDQDMIPLFAMQPGSFEVVLCVDQCEVAAGAKANRKRMMLEQLKKSGILMDIRKLQLGDFLWIAREKASHTGCRRELVLDFIVERKRMDDLAGSIVDGRFKEQKFRLKSCGLKHIIYLIESFGSMQHMVLPEANLRQAIVNSQVGDDLFVRKTENTYESATYLARMTRLLQSSYEHKVLLAFPVDYLETKKHDLRYQDLIRNRTQNLFTFGDFNQLTAKNKMLTVKEMFAKQLMQLKGVSSDKAAAIVQLYPTPKCLVLALKVCDSDILKQNMLSDITYGRAKRKIGPILSKQIQLLYESTMPLT